jgi:hypothetical protein
LAWRCNEAEPDGANARGVLRRQSISQLFVERGVVDVLEPAGGVREPAIDRVRSAAASCFVLVKRPSWAGGHDRWSMSRATAASW